MNRCNKIVFMGSTSFSKKVLEFLHEYSQYDVVAVYTKPDAVRGRGNKLEETIVKQYAQSKNIPVETPENFNDEITLDKLWSYKPTYICVVAYGLILPQEVLDIPRWCLNIHPSNLPKLRGAAPVERAILQGETCIPVSIMKMDAGLDTGDYVMTNSCVRIENKMLDEIYDGLAEIGTNSLCWVLQNINDPTFKWIKQNDNEHTEAEKIGKKELWYSSGDTDETFMRKIQASSPSNPSKCRIAGRIVTVLEAQFNNGVLTIMKVKPDGKNEMDWKSFVAGLQGVDESELKWEPIE